MPVQISFMNASATQALKRDLAQLANDFAKNGGLREPVEKIVCEVFIPSITQNFQRGGRPKRWEPLAPATVARRGGSGGAKPLVHTRKMSNAAKALARWTIRGNEAVYDLKSFPESSWFAFIHDGGFDSGVWDIPQRQFAMIQMPEDGNHAIEILAEWVRRKVLDRTRRVYR